MNLRNTCPDIPDNWKGSITDACRLLGDEKPLSSHTIYRYISLGVIKPKKGMNGRLKITGVQLKRLWAAM